MMRNLDGPCLLTWSARRPEKTTTSLEPAAWLKNPWRVWRGGTGRRRCRRSVMQASAATLVRGEPVHTHTTFRVFICVNRPAAFDPPWLAWRLVGCGEARIKAEA